VRCIYTFMQCVDYASDQAFKPYEDAVHYRRDGPARSCVSRLESNLLVFLVLLY